MSLQSAALLPRWLPAPSVAARELAGAVADIGVLVPIAVALIVRNGLSATAVLLVPGVLYLGAAAVYRLPVPVQPLKALGAIAIARGLDSDTVAAAALLMGLVFTAVGVTGAADRLGRALTRPLVRGIQLAVGLLLVKIAVTLVVDPPAEFATYAPHGVTLVALTAAIAAAALWLRDRPVALFLVLGGVVVAAVRSFGAATFGPAAVELPQLSWATLGSAFVVLVIPQLPLTLANSCVATADTARAYFGDAAQRVTPSRLATTLGVANVAAGVIGGMPVCHGAGGMTAHRSFGARTAAAPAAMGAALCVLALGFGSGLAAVLPAFPVAVLAALLGVSGLLHVRLLRDLSSRADLAIAVLVGIVGLATNLAVGLLAGAAVVWLPRAVRSARSLPGRRLR